MALRIIEDLNQGVLVKEDTKKKESKQETEKEEEKSEE